MRLYHGSNVAVQEPRLMDSKRMLDFGNAFYMTSDLKQATQWAIRTTKWRNIGEPLVSVFELGKIEHLNVLTFQSPDAAWLQFVVAHRTGALIHDLYDLVVGPVANDQTMRTINDYIEGRFSQGIALQLLLPQKLKDQYAFKTENSLKTLTYVEVIKT